MHNKHVALLTIDRPPANALSSDARLALIGHLDALAGQHEVRCVVLIGAGAVFTAGADLREAVPSDAEVPGSLVEEFQDILRGLEELRCPVIAAVNGAAAGGGLEVALACDIRIASDEAVFVAAGVKVGLVASFWRLPRVVGLGRAKQMLLTGLPCSAATALHWGLVTEVVPPANLLSRALSLADQIADLPPLSVEATKACTHAAFGLGRQAADELGAETLRRLSTTADHHEAVRAFLERRPSHFTGR